MEERQSLDLLNYRAGLESALPEQVTNSDVFVTLDTGVLIFDIKGKRVKITDFAMDLTEREIKNLLAPLPKFYFSSDTHRLFRYVNDTCYPLDGRDDTYSKLEINEKLSRKSDTDHTHEDLYATLEHDHNGDYYTKYQMNDALLGKSDNGHIHDNRYYTMNEIDEFLNKKSDSDHNHDNDYAAKDHNHDLVYQTIEENTRLLANKADTDHSHGDTYATSDHDHDARYYTEDEINEKLLSKSDSGHTHEDLYYTKTECDEKIAEIVGDEFDGDFGEELDDTE